MDIAHGEKETRSKRGQIDVSADGCDTSTRAQFVYSSGHCTVCLRNHGLLVRATCVVRVRFSKSSERNVGHS